MSHADLFAKLGVLMVADFLTLAECARLRNEMDAAPQTEAVLSVRGRTDEIVDPRRRRSGVAKVSEQTTASIVARILALKPRLESFYATSFAGIVEAPKFLIYRPGDFFEPHKDVDVAEQDTRAPLIRARRVNLIVALNAQSDTPAVGEYGDGDLTLYGLIDKPEWKTYGFPVPLDPGSLVAFRSQVVHEVAPVSRGERYSIVSRMLDQSFEAATAPPAAGGTQGDGSESGAPTGDGHGPRPLPD